MKNIFILELSVQVFEFDEKLFWLEIGAAMGGKPAPDYANIFMAKVDQKILQPMDCLKVKTRLSYTSSS